MPYKSAAQRAYLHIHEPALAAKWDKKYGGKVSAKPDPKVKARGPHKTKGTVKKKGKK